MTRLKVKNKMPIITLASLWQLKLRLLRLVMFSTSVTITLLVFIQVVSRYLFNYSFFGIEEVASYLAIVMYFIGAAYGTHVKGHISASIVDTLCEPGRFVDLAHILTRVISALLCLYLASETWELVQFNSQMGVRSVEIRMPMAWIYSSMLFGMLLMAFYFALEALEACKNLIKHNSKKRNQS